MEVKIPSAPLVFDRRLVRLRRERAAPRLHAFDFLIRHAGELLAERLRDVRRTFARVLDLGCHTGQLARILAGSDQIGELVQSDLARGMVGRAEGQRLVADEEALPFGADTFDLVLSCCSLHWVNDLPGALAQIRHALKPDGLLLAAFPGGATLAELREALMQAELEVTGGAGMRVSPFVDIRDAGTLLQRAGFALPVVDVENLTVTYGDPLRLLGEVRAMGEASAFAESSQPLSRPALARALKIYGERFADARGRVPASFQILMLAGWKPAPGQPQPKRRGSAQVDLEQALNPPGAAGHPARRL